MDWAEAVAQVVEVSLTLGELLAHTLDMESVIRTYLYIPFK